MKDSYSPPPAVLAPGAQVWIYCRDSGGVNQTESVRQQEEAIRAYCEKHGLLVEHVFKDVARSGGSVVKRDEFMAMIERSQHEVNRPRGLLCYDISRFARNYNEFNHYESILNMRGIVVHYLDENIPEDFFAGQVVKAVKALGAEEFRRDLSKKVKRGLDDLVRMGFAPGTPPRGYIAQPVEIGTRRDGKPRMVSKWVPDPGLMEYVKLAWEMRANGKSVNEIMEATGGKLYTSKNCFTTFFRNKSYLGYYRDIADHHEPLITHEVFEAVQKLMNVQIFKREKYHPRRVASPTLLSGICRCADCGDMMVYGVANRNHPWRFYMCGRKGRQGYAACKSKRVGANNAEMQIMKTVKEKILTVEYLAEVIAETKKRFASKDKLEKQITAKRRELEEIDIAIQRTLNTIEKTGSAAAQERLAQRESERAKVKADYDKLSAQLTAATIEIPPAVMDKIVGTWQSRLAQLEEAKNVRELKTWLSQFIAGIDLGYNKATIHVTYKMTDVFTKESKQLKSVSSRGGT